MTDIVYRELHTMQDFNKTLALQQAVWKMKPGDCTSSHTMMAVIHNGGHILGAELDGRLVGMTFAFAGKRGDEVFLWSHMAAVHPDLQGRGIGVRLKQEQRTWALDNGYTRIGWTFDPMRRGNANFNFNRLGVVACQYKVNLYGAMTDGINAGLASDRLEAFWNLNSPSVQALARGETPPQPTPASFKDEDFLVRVEGEKAVITNIPTMLNRPICCIEIPANLNSLKAENRAFAIDWQRAVRTALIHAFDQGYVATDFVDTADRCWYVLRRG